MNAKIFETAAEFCRFCQDFEGELVINRDNCAIYNGVIVAKFKKR
jgi:hypothetical protein